MRSLLAVMLALVAGCGEAPQPADAPGQVTGQIVEVARDGANTIVAFTVEDRNQDRYEIRIEPERDYGFDLEHLQVHHDQDLPVVVRLDERGGALYALEILDA